MPSAEEAHLMVNQGVATLRDSYEAQVRENQKLRRQIRNLENGTSDIDVWKTKQVRDLQTRVAELEATERRLREFMRLKDNAKIKVERTRDTLKRTVEGQQAIINVLRSQRLDRQALEEQNEAQARAFKVKEEQCAKQQSKIRDLQGRLDNVMQIMQNAVNGVRSDNPYGEWRPWPNQTPRSDLWYTNDGG